LIGGHSVRVVTRLDVARRLAARANLDAVRRW
jgi:hypothetical protein